MDRRQKITSSAEVDIVRVMVRCVFLLRLKYSYNWTMFRLCFSFKPPRFDSHAVSHISMKPRYENTLNSSTIFRLDEIPTVVENCCKKPGFQNAKRQ